MTAKPPTRKPDKSRLIIGIMLVLVLLGGIVSFLSSGGKAPKKAPREERIVIVTPPPPPPPPPVVTPPPPPPPPKDEDMVQQEEVPDDEPPPDAPAPEAPPAGIDSNTGGKGPAIAGGTGGGNRIGGSGRKGGGSKWGYYAAKVQTTVKSALAGNASTQKATFSLQVRIWADSSGNITKAVLVGSSGNPAVDQAIRNQVLVGLQLPEPPPAGMPMPITLRIAARKS